MKKIPFLKFFGCVFMSVFSCYALATMPGDEALEYSYRLCSSQPYKNRSPEFGCPKIEKITYRVSIYQNNDLQEKIKNHMKKSIKKYIEISRHNQVELIQQKSHIELSHPIMKNVAYGDVPDQHGIDINFSVRLVEENGNLIAYVVGVIVSNYSYDVMTDISNSLNAENLPSYLEKIVEKFVHNQLAENVFPDARSKIENSK